jgi:hypothetical protein
MTNEFKENTLKQANELRKTIQDIKEQFNKEIKILKKNQTEILKMKSPISQIKISFESITH